VTSSVVAGLVTVYVPCYQVARYLPAALEGVLAQTYPQWELLVIVDAASTDDTAAIARRYAELDPRIRVIDVPHCEVTAKYQLGADEGRGEWLAPLDGDDVWYPQRLERQLAAAAARPEVVAWSCWYDQIGDDGTVLRPTHYAPTTIEEFEDHRRRHEVPYLLHSGHLIRRSAFEAVGGYHHDTRLAACFNLVDRLCDVGPVLNVPEVLIGYRLASASHSLAKWPEQSRQLAYIWERRRRNDLSEAAISYDEFVAEWDARPALERARRASRERSRFYWRAAGTALGEHHRAGAAKATLQALAWNPLFAGGRIVEQFVRPAARRLIGRGTPTAFQGP
jgi:glycosyltransferase involved in cell wall biosynthesis